MKLAVKLNRKVSFAVLISLIRTDIVFCDEITVKSSKMIGDDGTIHYCPDVPAEVSSTGHRSEANNMCILTCIVQSDLFSPFLEINGTLCTIQEINSSASFSVHYHSREYSLVFSCMPLLYRCCTSEDVCSDVLHLKEDADSCESERTPLPSETPTSHYPTIHPTFPTNRTTSNDSIAVLPEDTRWKEGLGVSFGLLSVIVIIAVAICLLIAVIYNYKDTSLPLPVEESDNREGENQFALDSNVHFKRSTSERSFKEGIEECGSNHQPLSDPLRGSINSNEEY